MHTHRNTFVKKWRLYVKNKDNGTKKFNIEI